eukprot:11652434-Alexandrium_andersonii.AAC.1
MSAQSLSLSPRVARIDGVLERLEGVLQSRRVAGDIARLSPHLGVPAEDASPERRCVFSALWARGSGKDEGELVRLAGVPGDA